MTRAQQRHNIEGIRNVTISILFMKKKCYCTLSHVTIGVMEDVSSPDDRTCEIRKLLMKIFDVKLFRIEGSN
jgi:hypothetical protein